MSEIKIGLDNCVEDDREWYENDLQLAAELGMALLKRNQELENIVYQKQLIIDEQLQEIELLTRQAATLRELNESRLKIYEQLEQSISELEKINQKLHSESSVDKKRIQNLCNSVELLEKKCEELESMVDELRISNNKNYPAFSQTDISIFDENAILDILPAGEKSKETDETYEVMRLQNCLSQLNLQLSKEQKKYYDLELERDILIQENTELQNALQAWENNNNNNNSHLSEDDTLKEENRQTNVLSVLENRTEVEEHEVSSQECILVQLKNGIVAYGNRESLETACDTVEEYCDKKNTANGISLLTELDAQYKDLMEKYDILIGSRKQTNFEAGLNAEMDNDDDCSLGLESKDFTTISDDLSHQTNCKYIDVAVQTEISGEANTNHSYKKILNLNSTNSLSGRFDHSCPTYKKLFEEIFSILKRSLQVDETEKSETNVTSESNDQTFSHQVPNKTMVNQNSCRKFTYAEVLLNGKTKQKVIPL